MNRVLRWFGGALVIGLLAGCSDQVTGPEVNPAQRASSLQHVNAHHDFDKKDLNMDDDSTKAKPKKGRYAMGAN
jgi:hypothetical protein